ncbi:hypothetical protein F2P56_019181 [Juglans regia]|uniref:Uncharacterized protein n=1 Tax=Juglans regia TaxID=51240 RepID=A0A833XB79_JUGRE|nr:hypothetical protein F2P56_019181 [Juglans regia]
MQVATYTVYATYFNLLSITKRCPEQKEISIAAMEKNKDVKPIKSFIGKSFAKSLSLYLDVKMERNVTKAVTEKKSAMSDEMAKMWNGVLFSNVGMPISSLTPPGTAVEVAKATVAMSAATRELDSEVLINQSPPSLTSFL